MSISELLNVKGPEWLKNIKMHKGGHEQTKPTEQIWLAYVEVTSRSKINCDQCWNYKLATKRKK